MARATEIDEIYQAFNEKVSRQERDELEKVIDIPYFVTNMVK